MTVNRRLLFYTLYLAYIATGIVSILPGPTLPLLARNTGVSLAVAGWVFTMGALGFSLGVLLAGILSSRLGSKSLLIVGLLLLSAMGVAIPIIHNFSLMLGAQFALGFGFGFLDVSITTIVGLAFQDTLGETFNYLHSSYGIGALVAPLLLSIVLQLLHDASWAYFIGSIAGLVAILFALRQHIPTQAKPSIGQQSSRVPLTLSVLRRPLLWLLALQLALYVGAEVGFGNWLVTAVSQSAFIPLALAAPAATCFWFGLTAGRLLGGQILKRSILSENQLLYISIVGGGISGLLVAGFPGQVWISFGASVLAGCCFGPIFPGIMTMASRLFRHALGIVSGVMLISAGIAGMIVPVLMGFLISPIGVNWVMAIPALICLTIVVPFTIAFLQQRRVSPTLPAEHRAHSIKQETSVHR